MATAFLIWTTQRTGSTVFWRTLGHHPRIEAHGEMFLPEMTREDSYASFLGASRWRRLERWLSPSRSVARYCDRLFAGGPGVDAVGCKLMYNHLSPPLEAWIDRARPKLVHLVRRNHLKLLASRVAAERRGLYHLEPGADVPADRVALDPREVATRLERIAREVERGRAFTAGRDAMEVAYEDLLAEREATYTRVFTFLGVPAPEAPLPEPLRKINPDSLPELIGNYDEVRRSLEGTPFSAFLERG